MPETDTYVVTAQTDLKGITALRARGAAGRVPAEERPRPGGGRELRPERLAASSLPRRNSSGPPMGRFVRVELPGKKKILSLAEVQVSVQQRRQGFNVATKGKATQSSTTSAPTREARYRRQHRRPLRGRKSTAHTNDQDDPWWEVDLGAATSSRRSSSGTASKPGRAAEQLPGEGARCGPQDAVADAVGAAPKPEGRAGPERGSHGRAGNASSTFQQTQGGEWSAAKAIDADAGANSGWAVAPEVGKRARRGVRGRAAGRRTTGGDAAHVHARAELQGGAARAGSASRRPPRRSRCACCRTR